jgi:hypothetical protein
MAEGSEVMVPFSSRFYHRIIDIQRDIRETDVTEEAGDLFSARMPYRKLSTCNQFLNGFSWKSDRGVLESAQIVSWW